MQVERKQFIPALYHRPQLLLNDTDRQIFDSIIKGEGYIVPEGVLDQLLTKVYLANKVIRPWMGMESATTLFREAVLEGREKNDPIREGYEIFIDSGCTHGTKPEKLIEIIQRDHPDSVFISDLVGSKGFSEESKKIYYNKLMNIVRNSILPAHPEYDNDDSSHIPELLHINNSTDAGKMHTPKDGFMELANYVLKFNPDDSCARQMKSWDNEQMALWIWYFAHGKQFHGEWMSTLDKETRQRILNEVERDTEALVHEIESKKGDTEIHYYEGNWDAKVTMFEVSKGNRIGREVVRRIIERNITKREILHLRTLKFKPDAEDKATDRELDYESILRRNKIRLVRNVEGFETKNCYHILGPYFGLLHLSKYDFNYRKMLKEALTAKRRGKAVVLHMHGVPNREYLYLDKPLVSVEDNKIIQDKIHMIMLDTRAQILIHPHEHDPKRNLDGSIMFPNSHVVYSLKQNRIKELIRKWVPSVLLQDTITNANVVTKTDHIGDRDNAISVYTPLLSLAVTVVGPEEEKDFVKGTSLPPKVLNAPEGRMMIGYTKE